MALQTKVVTHSWAPTFTRRRSELGVRAGAAAAAAGLYGGGKISAVLPVGEVVAIQMEAEGGCLCSGVVTGDWTPVDFVT